MTAGYWETDASAKAARHALSLVAAWRAQDGDAIAATRAEMLEAGPAHVDLVIDSLVGYVSGALTRLERNTGFDADGWLADVQLGAIADGG